MSDAEILREAAALMRSRATVTQRPGIPEWYSVGSPGLLRVARTDRPHIASWHPAVALAVADWLDADPDVMERHDLDATVSKAYAVARVYLGRADG